MEVYNWPFPSVAELPPEFVTNDLVAFVEASFRDKSAITIKCLQPGKDIIRIKAAIGYYPHYGVIFFSNPDNDRGLAVADTRNRRVIYSERGFSFWGQRDAFVYNIAGQGLYVPATYEVMLREFGAKGYTFAAFQPKDEHDSMIWQVMSLHKTAEQLATGKTLSVEDLLLPNN